MFLFHAHPEWVIVQNLRSKAIAENVPAKNKPVVMYMGVLNVILTYYRAMGMFYHYLTK